MKKGIDFTTTKIELIDQRKTIDLSDLKVGDKAFSAKYGEVEIVANYEKGKFPICIFVEEFRTRYSYSYNGFYNEDESHPTLFRSLQEFLEYWSITGENRQPTELKQISVAALQGLLSNPNLKSPDGDTYAFRPADLARLSVDHAKAIIKEISKQS